MKGSVRSFVVEHIIAERKVLSVRETCGVQSWKNIHVGTEALEKSLFIAGVGSTRRRNVQIEGNLPFLQEFALAVID